MTKNPVMIAALAAAALALGACGSDGGNASSGKPSKSDEDKAYAGALKFAKCMRDNGIDMPDPQKASGGGILQRMGRGKGEPPINEAKMEAAQKRCEHFMDTGGGDIKGPGDDSKQRDAMLNYSKCMRENGIPEFPDPKFSGNKAELSIKTKDGSVNLNPDAPRFKAAEKVCQQIMADVMGGGPATAKKGEG